MTHEDAMNLIVAIHDLTGELFAVSWFVTVPLIVIAVTAMKTYVRNK